MRLEGFTLANYPNDPASLGTADIKKYYSVTLPNIIYNNDTKMDLAELTKTADPQANLASSVLKNDWKKSTDIALNPTLAARFAECENTGSKDQFAHLTSLANTVDTSSKLRCGWMYNTADYTRGRGALGIMKGPLKTSASGAWMWDLNDAKKRYHTDICKNIKDCSDIGANMYKSRCGWCTQSGKAVPINNNNVAYPSDLSTGCPPSNLIINSNKCPVAVSNDGAVITSKCTPLENGALSRECLMQKVMDAGCSDAGTLYQALNAGSNNDYLSNLRQQKPWTIYQQRATLPMDDTSLKYGKLTAIDALNGFNRIQEQMASPANTGLKYASRDLCLKKGELDTFDFCSELSDSTIGPFSLDCLQKVFLRAGGQKTGRQFPTNSTIAGWNGLGTWSAVKSRIQTLINNTRSSVRETQEAGMLDFYGIPLEKKKPVYPSIDNVTFVRLQGTGNASFLNFSQLVVYDDTGANISRGRPVQSSSRYTWGGDAANANDGNETPRPYPHGFHGMGSGKDYWQVQLDRSSSVSSVMVYNRSDCCSDRLGSGYVIQLYDKANSLIWTSNPLNGNQVQKIIVDKDNSAKSINIAEASYGVNCNASLRGNRTQFFQNLVNSGINMTNYSYDYTKTGGDPAGGCGKTLEIKYNCAGGPNKMITVPPEAGVGGKVNLQC
jgi:hypothetical protein